MIPISDYIIIFIMAFIGSLIGSAAGGGGGMPAFLGLMFTGMPIHIAIGTQKVGEIGHYLIAVPNYIRSGKVIWRIAIVISLIGIVGGLIGASIVISTGERVVEWVVGILLLLLLLYLLLNKEFGVKRKKRSFLWIPSYVLTQIYEGFFGAGAGIFSVMSLVRWRGITFTKAIGTHKMGSLATVVTAAAVFMTAGVVNYSAILPYFTGSALGGYVGSTLAIEKGEKWIRGFLIATIATTILFLILKNV